MPRQKPANKQSNLDEILKDYDRRELAGAVAALEGNIGWIALKAILQTEMEWHNGVALEFSRHGNRQIEASAASGAGDGIRQVLEELIPKYVQYLRGDSPVVENPPPEE